MGIFGKLEKFIGKDGAKQPDADDAITSPERAIELYQRLKRSKSPIPGKLLNTIGDMYRDLNNLELAIDFYEQAAFRFIEEESWTVAEAVVRKIETYAKRPTVNGLLASMEIALGRGLSGNAISTLERLGKVLKPSDGEDIARLIEIVDRYPAADSSVEVRLSELLCVAGRPERAVERLQVAYRVAKRAGDHKQIEDIESRLDQLDPARDSLTPRGRSTPQETESGVIWSTPDTPAASSTTDAPAAPAPAPAAPIVTPPVLSDAPVNPAVESSPPVVFPHAPSAPASRFSGPLAPVIPPPGGTVRVVGKDARSAGRDDSEVVRELVAQLKAGLAEQLSPDDVEEHYDLGIAFLEMRIFDEAVRELQIAFRSPAFRLRAAEGLAKAMVERGDALLTDRLVDEVIDSMPATSEDGRIGLYYWKARALEMMGQARAARDLYVRVAMIDSTYLDARTRLARLST